MSLARAMSVATIASFKDGWIFRSHIARHIGASLRTVQRGITQARDLGLLGVARAKKGEIPPGLSERIPCGWSHRWVIGWGQGYEAARAAIEACRLKRLMKNTVHRVIAKATRRGRLSAEQIDQALEQQELDREKTRIVAPPPAPTRRMTADELDQELERIARARGQPP